MSLKISSINVKGYRQKFKRDIIWSRLVQLNFDIVFMQETNVTNLGEAKKFSKDFDGKCYWSFGSTRARGVDHRVRHQSLDDTSADPGIGLILLHGWFER